MTSEKKIKLVIGTGVTAFVVLQAGFAWGFYLSHFGRVLSSLDIQLENVAHRVVLRERCYDPLNAVLDRLTPRQQGNYEYWTELYRGKNLVAMSERETWGDTSYAHAMIQSADSKGVTVNLDRQEPKPYFNLFEWKSQPN